MRLLVVTPDFPPAYGGIQLLMDRLGRHLSGHDVSILTVEQDGAATFDREYPRAVSRVSMLRGRRLSIIALNAAIQGATAKTSPEAILSGHIVCGPGAVLAGVRARVPVLQYVYAMELTSRGGIASSVLPRVDTTIAISLYAANLARTRGARPGRIAVVHPGVDVPPPPPGSRANERTPTIITIARLVNRYKGFDVMLRALPLVLARVPDAKWVVVGDGPLRCELETSAVRAGLGGHVRFLGGLSDLERDDWLQRSHVFVMLSRLQPDGSGEGFGIAFLEAGRFCVPSVGGAEGGAVDAVLNGLTGTLVDPRDHVAVADAITELLLDNELRHRYGEAARKRAAELSWSRMAKGVEEALRVAIAR